MLMYIKYVYRIIIVYRWFVIFLFVKFYIVYKEDVLKRFFVIFDMKYWKLIVCVGNSKF